jgi:hypothetical protein
MASDPYKLFLAAAAKVERAIGDLSAGRFEGMPHQAAREVFQAVDRLDARASESEIRGSEHAAEAWNICARLRRSVSPAEEKGREAWRSARDAEARAEREEAARRRPRPGTWEHELALMRGRSR